MKKQPPSAAILDVSPGLRRFLYATAAVTGGVILIVEILGAKLLSPYLGTSHFVWTAQIAVTLVALACGYYFGGWLVDRSPKLERIYLCVLAAGLYLCAVLPVIKPVAYRSIAMANLAAGALLTSLILFFVPLTLLAAVGPFFIRVLTQSVSKVGGQVGRLTSISTLGSVAGTVSISYFLIPFLPNSVTLFLTAGLLLAVVGLYFFIWGRRSRQGPYVAVLAAIGLVFGYGGSGIGQSEKSEGIRELYRGNSNFGLLQVVENQWGTRRYYLNDFLTQNTYDPESKESMSLFTYMLHWLAKAYTPAVDDVLCIGLGVGIVPMKFLEEGADVDVVEINPDVIPLAEEFFGLQPDRLDLTVADGRFFVNQTTNRYDAVVLDAFLGDSSPSHLMTREAFGEMKRILKENGVLVINSFGEFAPGKDTFVAALDQTLRTVFRSVLIHASGNGNVFFVASDQEELSMDEQPPFAELPGSVRTGVRAAFSGVVERDLSHGRVLTDDFNPIEFFDAGNREELRRRLALSMRDL